VRARCIWHPTSSPYCLRNCLAPVYLRRAHTAAADTRNDDLFATSSRLRLHAEPHRKLLIRAAVARSDILDKHILTGTHHGGPVCTVWFLAAAGSNSRTNYTQLQQVWPPYVRGPTVCVLRRFDPTEVGACWSSQVHRTIAKGRATTIWRWEAHSYLRSAITGVTQEVLRARAPHVFRVCSRGTAQSFTGT
jgi:hypothetical protein